MNTKEANQKVFDAALTHIRQQGCASVTDLGSCVYRNPEGLGCAFSPAIKYYDPEIEGHGSWDLREKFPGRLHDFGINCDGELAARIQDAHDAYSSTTHADCFLELFEGIMKIIAQDYNIVYEAA